ncbi:MAG: universal stress protein [Acidimicrobiales bacterium]
MTGVRTIAVGFDGSPDADTAVRWAMDVAGQTGADVAVVHAVGLLEHSADPALVVRLGETVGDMATEQGLDHARVHWHLVDGDPCSALLRVADSPIGADLLVVGSRGQGAHAGLLLGSTSHELAEHATIPLVIVPTGE